LSEWPWTVRAALALLVGGAGAACITLALAFLTDEDGLRLDRTGRPLWRGRR